LVDKIKEGGFVE